MLKTIPHGNLNARGNLCTSIAVICTMLLHINSYIHSNTQTLIINNVGIARHSRCKFQCAKIFRSKHVCFRNIETATFATARCFNLNSSFYTERVCIYILSFKHWSFANNLTFFREKHDFHLWYFLKVEDSI